MEMRWKASIAAVCLVLSLTACSGAGPGAGTPSPAESAGSKSAAPRSVPTPQDQETDNSSSLAGPDRPQVISGLGVNANVHSWNDGELKPAVDKIAELGEVTWRVIIDKADWEAEPIGNDPGVIDWKLYEPLYSTGKVADLWDTVEYINTKPGQQVMVNVMGGVPAWMGGRRIDPAFEDHWVRTVASMVAYGRQVRNVDFKLLAPMNEPDLDGIEGPQVEPDQYARLLHKLILKLDELGLSDIRLVGPDTASATEGKDRYLPALQADALVHERLAVVAVHSYDQHSADIHEAVRESPGLEHWITEFSGPCPSCDVGSPNPMNWDSASETASFALAHLQNGASGLLHYDAWDGYYEHHQSTGYWGLLAYDAGTGEYSPRKSYYVLKQLIQYVPRGALRIAASAANDDVNVVAFEDPDSGRVTIVGQNRTGSPVQTKIQLPDAVQPFLLQASVTNAERDMAPDGEVNLDAGAADFLVPASSVFTLTGISTKG